ncbi:hypothetical protein C8Q79DRAFT_998441 [Trametes meyenii]|nr:hypothetical protein C8Q79DRAFT_998441 [Trametes meyenii]
MALFVLDKANALKREDFKVEPLRYGTNRIVDIPKATRSSYDAFLDDSYIRYFADADTVPLREQREKLRISSVFADNVYVNKIYCVNHGDAIVSVGVSGSKRGLLGSILTPVLDSLDPKELSKRKTEFREKVEALLRSAFGDDIKNMLEIRGLATAPEKQGRGYGTALMRLVDEMSDVQGRAVYAVTTDAHRFYESIGYSTLREGFIGGDNPNWNGPPVGIRIVLDEQTPLLVEKLATTPSTEKLRYAELPKAVRTGYDANLDDTFTVYFNDADTAPGQETRTKLGLGVGFLDGVYRGKAWTVNHGEAILLLNLPGVAQGPVLPILAPLFKSFDSDELRKRKQEFAAKLIKMLKEAFDSKVEDMIEVQALATAPEKQGRGYGTTLMEFVNAKADRVNRAVWLLTSDAHGFYERVGYSVLAHEVIGDSNPKWHGEPVHLRIVSELALLAPRRDVLLIVLYS